MKKFGAGIIVGVLIGIGLSSMINSKHRTVASENTVDEVQPEVVESKTGNDLKELLNSKRQPMDVYEKKQAIDLKIVPSASTQTHVQTEEPTRVLNIDLTEEQLMAMEDHLPELQKDVSLFRDRNGWIVRFHAPGNILSNIGIKDNDLIRFGQIQEMKKDPTKADMVSRLETVLGNLEQ